MTDSPRLISRSPSRPLRLATLGAVPTLLVGAAASAAPFLAQDGAAGPPPETAPLAAPSGGGGGAGQPAGQPDMLFLLVFVFIGFLLVTSFITARREKKRRNQMMSSLRKHDRVLTRGGVVGAVVELKPDYVVLKVDENSNTRVTFARSAIEQVLAPSSSGKDDLPEKEAGED